MKYLRYREKTGSLASAGSKKNPSQLVYVISRLAAGD